MTEDKLAQWHHRLEGPEFEQTPGVGDGQGSLVWCSPWSHKELDTTEQLNSNNALSEGSFVSPGSNGRGPVRLSTLSRCSR